jgi:hypothetical protein
VVFGWLERMKQGVLKLALSFSSGGKRQLDVMGLDF